MKKLLLFLGIGPKTGVFVLALLLVSSVALAAAYTGSLYTGGAIEQVIYAKGGLFVGTGTTADSTNRITLVKRCQLDNLDIGAAAAGAASVVTGTCTGVALATHVNIAPLQDDAAWDEGSLTAFVESANTVKVVYHADASGGDPAATNDYEITWWEHP